MASSNVLACSFFMALVIESERPIHIPISWEDEEAISMPLVGEYELLIDQNEDNSISPIYNFGQI